MDELADQLKDTIRKTPADILHETVYICISNACLLITAYKRENGKAGWSSKLVNSQGDPILQSKEQETLEKILKEAPWVLTFLNGDRLQKGGDLKDVASGSSFVESTDESKFDFSINEMFEALMKKTEEQDAFWNKIAYNAPGFSKLINTDIPVYGIPIPVRPIVYFLFALIDAIRLSAALSGNNSTALTLLLGIGELINGQWRQAILSFAGLISPTGTAITILLKYITNAMLLINPEIREDIARDIFKGTKSLFIGFLLWTASTFTPNILRARMEDALASVRGIVEQFDEKVKGLEEKGSAALKPYKMKLKFTGLDLSKVSKISLQDIQNLQAIASWDLIVCSTEFNEIVTGLSSIPALRLILEMLNIPTTPEDKLEKCGTTNFKSIGEVVEKAAEPHIFDSDSDSDAAAPAPEATAASEAASEAAPEAAASEAAASQGEAASASASASAPEAAAPEAPAEAAAPEATASAAPEGEAAASEATASASAPEATVAPAVKRGGRLTRKRLTKSSKKSKQKQKQKQQQQQSRRR